MPPVLTSGEQGFPDETAEYIEGATKKVFVNAYERNPKAREACIKQYGVSCIVCGLNFQTKYGAIGEGFIHVHHLKPIAKHSGVRVVNPDTDLRPVCPNCHAMLHISDPPLTIEELNEILGEKP
jgi:5-methylcytosine-specific restriction protein A